MIEITDEALQELIKRKDDTPFEYIRLGLTGGGCAGFQYIFDTDISRQPNDTLIDYGPIKFLVDDVSLPLIDDTTIVYVKDGLNEYFKYENPKEKSVCGCGVSVQF
jgi:iron-sulfur cluster assembly accessory protein